jgi:hypothetical protein
LLGRLLGLSIGSNTLFADHPATARPRYRRIGEILSYLTYPFIVCVIRHSKALAELPVFSISPDE